MNNKNQVLQAAVHIVLAVMCAIAFFDAVHREDIAPWFKWFWFGFTWVNVWIASQRWASAYENVD